MRNIGEKQERGKRRRDVEAFREVVLKNKNDKELQRLARLKECEHQTLYECLICLRFICESEAIH